MMMNDQMNVAFVDHQMIQNSINATRHVQWLVRFVIDVDNACDQVIHDGRIVLVVMENQTLVHLPTSLSFAINADVQQCIAEINVANACCHRMQASMCVQKLDVMVWLAATML